MKPPSIASLAVCCNVSMSTVLRWLKEGRILGASRCSGDWVIPRDWRLVMPHSKEAIKRMVSEDDL